MTLKIHAFPLSPRGFKVLFAANHLGLDYELKLVNFAAGDNRTPEFTALNINQRMPVLEEDGYTLWESDAILEYLAAKKPNAGLMPLDIKPRLQVTKWLYWDCAHWDQACAIFMFERVVKKLFNRGDEDPAEIARGSLLIDRLAKVLDTELGRHRYVAGDRLTVADFALVAPLGHSETARFPLEPYRGIARWVADMKALPAWDKTTALQRG